MKSPKMLYLDIELIEFLKGKNASELITRLLNEHMDHQVVSRLTKEETLAELKCIKLTKQHNKKLKEIRKNARK